MCYLDTPDDEQDECNRTYTNEIVIAAEFTTNSNLVMST